MRYQRVIAISLLVPFAVLSAYAVYKVGYLGIPLYHIHSPAGWQVFADLVIALVLVLMFIVQDAKANGRAAWPWVVGTLVLGSVSPLLYLAVYGGVRERH